MHKTMEMLKTIHRSLMWCAQVGVFLGSAVFAFLLRFDFAVPHAYFECAIWCAAVWVLVKSVVFRLFLLDRGWWRYVSVGDVRRLTAGNIVASGISFFALVAFCPFHIPRSLFALDFLLSLLGTAGIRFLVRILYESSRAGQTAQPIRRALIYGAGEGGVMLLRELQKNARLPYRICGFIDDMPSKKGALILGVTTMGSGEDLVRLVPRHHIDLVLIAIPTASGPQMTRILDLCHKAHVECKTVPSLTEIIEQGSLAGQIREVAVEDLLGRSPVCLEEEQIRKAIMGQVVLVTGAGGSIGSELCRQIARFQPAGIVGFESAESALFDIEQELRAKFPEIKFHPVVGNIQNSQRIHEVIRSHRPATIYHAAAYKHVPLMESHIFEAVENNVFGTYNVAAAAVRYGVRDFVLISSDKAVCPTNVMGATKRMAELLIMELCNGDTKFAAVRFGNVLGSNGSVIPIFKRQIAAGGPVTVTHPEIRRFFMTIPEACQLVLQAAVIAGSGEICVLDMGEPVRIVDLAEKLILLSGLRPYEDIRIEFTGVRPGEKMYEELNLASEETVPTTHDKIRIFNGSGAQRCAITALQGHLRSLCEKRDIAGLVVAMKEIVLDYNPSVPLIRQILAPQHAALTNNGYVEKQPQYDIANVAVRNI